MERRVRSKLKVSRASHKVEFRANTDNVKRLVPSEHKSFIYSICCAGCGHIEANLRIGDGEMPIEGTKETCNFQMNCSQCNKQIRVKYIENFIDQLTENTFNWQTLFTIDCKGCRIDLVACDDWKITTKSLKEYKWNGTSDFFEFDEQSGLPVGVVDLDFNVTPIK